MNALYLGADIPQGTYVEIEHLYPILEDDFTEMSNDRQEVAAGLRSRTGYIRKWGVAPDPLAELARMREENAS